MVLQILAALLLDALFGDPRWPTHPVVLVGRLITFYEKFFYAREDGRRRGLLFCAAVLATVAAVVAVAITAAGFIGIWAQTALNIYLLYAAIAFKSLKDESLPVARALASGNLERARKQVAQVVGIDLGRLDPGARLQDL